MKLVLSDYKLGIPVQVQQSYDPKELNIELVDLKFLEPLVLEGEVLKETDTITLRGRLRSRIRRICGRSLKEVDEDLDIPFNLYYVVQDCEEIETVDDIREAVLIEQPMVYYAPDSSETEFEDKDFEESKRRTSETQGPFSKLKKIRERLKEE